MFILASIVLYIATIVEAHYTTMSLEAIKDVQTAMTWSTIPKEDIMNAESGPILDALKYNIAKNFPDRQIVLPGKGEVYTAELKEKLPAFFGYGTLAGNAAGAFKALLNFVNSGYPADKVLIVYGLDYYNGKDWRTNDWYKLIEPVLVDLAKAGVEVYRFTETEDPAGSKPEENTCDKSSTEGLIQKIAVHGLITLDCWTGTGFQELDDLRKANMRVSTLGLNTINTNLHSLEIAAEARGLKIINLTNDVISGMFANSGKFSILVPSVLKFEGVLSAYVIKDFVNDNNAANEMKDTAVLVMLTPIKGSNGKNFYETAIELYQGQPAFAAVVKVMQDYLNYMKAGRTFVVHKPKSSEIE